MFYLNLKNRYGKKWHVQNGCVVSGFFHYQNRFLSGETLAAEISSSAFQSCWPGVLAEVDGNWCAVLQMPDLLRVAVDHLRSLPLFYAVRGEDVYLSDDAFWVREQVGDEMLDELSASEYLLAGFVSGSDTLYPHVKQVQAGEAITFRRASGGISIQAERYCRYVHGDFFRDNEDTLMERMDACYREIGEEFLESLAGRTIVVPLSGGYDSRLLVLLLKRLKYDKVLAFSYGLPGNRESEISRRLAQSLNIPWYFAEYSRKFWADWFSERRDEYYRYADNLCSLPHLQDWPAVWLLRERGVIPEDGVIVPGHTALATTHVPPSLLQPCSLPDVVAAIIQKKYYMQPYKAFRAEIWEQIQAKIQKIVETIYDGSPERSASAFECFEWQERQAKFIINSVRVYELWGLDWRVPLWSRRAMQFWQQMPLSHRFEKRLYWKYIERQNASFSVPPKPKMLAQLRAQFREVLDILGLRAAAKRARARYEFKHHKLGWHGLIPAKIYGEFLYVGEPILCYLTRERLGCVNLSLPPRDTLQKQN